MISCDYCDEWFHLACLTIIERISDVWYCDNCSNTRKMIPDRLVDSCKHSNINQMAAGSRLPRSSHGIFSNIPCLIQNLYV